MSEIQIYRANTLWRKDAKTTDELIRESWDLVGKDLVLKDDHDLIVRKLKKEVEMLRGQRDAEVDDGISSNDWHYDTDAEMKSELLRKIGNYDQQIISELEKIK